MKKMADMKSIKGQVSGVNLRVYIIFLGVVWTIIVICSLGWNIYHYYQEKLEVGRAICRSHYEKDMLLRKWNISHGFVYAPVTGKNPPNPYLTLPKREIVCTGNQVFTALNSSYMLRQIHQMAEMNLEIKGRMTSLRPLRPENSPDPWEAKALNLMAKGAKEVSEQQVMNGKEYLRLMGPVPTEKGCLNCHGLQGWQAGDIMGGISVSLPMASIYGAGRMGLAAIYLGHGFLWLLGLAVLALGGSN